MVQNVVLVFLRRRLSQRPNVEELESRNILKREFRKIALKMMCLSAAAPQVFSSVRLKAQKSKRSCSLFSSRTHECVLPPQWKTRLSQLFHTLMTRSGLLSGLSIVFFFLTY